MIPCSSLMVSINCSVHVAFETQLESLAKTLLLWEVLVCWRTWRKSKDNLFGQEIILTPKRQSHLMQRFLEFFQWWGLPFHTVLLNVLLPDLNWMLCDIVTVLAWILLQEHPLSLKICYRWDFAWNQNTMIQTVLYQNGVSHNPTFLIQYLTKLPYVCAWQSNDHSWKLKIFITNCKFYLKQSSDAKSHTKQDKVIITFNMIDVHIIVLLPLMVW